MMQERELPHSQYSKDPEQILIEQIEATEIKAALRGIPVIQQKRFLMHHLIGLSIKQIAKLEGCSDRAIKYSLALARSNLRNILSE
ncbi:MAG: sigma factor-like helix-turn-helix DNA-binding protein [Raoultibacter sp.]